MTDDFFVLSEYTRSTDRWTERQRQTYTETDRQTDRQTYIHRDRQTDRQKGHIKSSF